jgi:hypothetical protein
VSRPRSGDVADSLYDVFKLGTQTSTLAAGFCVIAGHSRDWRAPRHVAGGHRHAGRWDVTALRDREREWARIYARTAIRPTELPARIRTVAGEPIAMPMVSDHEIRVIGVQAVGPDRIRLGPLGALVAHETKELPPGGR